MMGQSDAIVEGDSGLSPEVIERRNRILKVGILRGTLNLYEMGLKQRSEVEELCRATLALYPDVQEALDFLATSETVVESPM